MTLISFYSDNHRSLCPPVIKPRVGKLKNQGEQTKNKFPQNVCPPWPETVVAHLAKTKLRYILHRKVEPTLKITHGDHTAVLRTNWIVAAL